MTIKKAILFFLFVWCQFAGAQNDSVNALDEVVVSDRQLRAFSSSQTLVTLNDSVIAKNRPSLTSLLNYNSVISFKENGYGMVSSPGFRGTTAQQTAVVWNGININSQFNGQTDFNTVNSADFSAISIRAGGGSVIYGSGAVGGTIHLNNDLKFGKDLSSSLSFSYGSFQTAETAYRINASSEKFAFQAGVSHNSSNNDFALPNGGRNVNGQYYNSSYSAAFGYRFDRLNKIKFYSSFFDGDRHFALFSPSDTKTKYRDFNTRNMVEWTNSARNMTSSVKAAWLTEEYRYFEDIALPSQDFGKASTFLAKYDVLFRFRQGVELNVIADYSNTLGKGSDVGKNTREIWSAALLFRHAINKTVTYEAGAKKEFTGDYESPFLFSGGLNLRLAKNYLLKLNGSKNFRIPTFNDLYWSEGGNPDLLPESSYQAELGNEITIKDLKFSLTGYYIHIRDMIQWLPGTSSVWFPRNISRVTSRGIEAIGNWEKSFGRHNISVAGTYAYTVSENDQTGKQLIYVPYHKATLSTAYRFGRISGDIQTLMNGEMFSRSDNNPHYNVDGYAVMNIGTDYRLGKKNIGEIGIRVMNIFDEEYEVMAARPFPGRNYQLHLTLNF